jgi:hypothetical protein
MDQASQATGTSEASPLRAGDPHASALIWDWRNTADPPTNTAEDRRMKGVFQGVVGLVVGTALYLLLSEHMGMLVWTVATLIMISALVSPDRAYAAIERFIDWLVQVVGKGVTLLVMVPVFYLVFLPFGLLLRRGRKDTMKRFYEDSADSYWLTRATETTAEDRERLF